MNSNTLRIRGSDNKKTKCSINFTPVVLPENYKCQNTLCNKFLETSAEDQLVLLKQILYNMKENCDNDIVNFLVNVYLHTDPKHPVKCMVTRYITKNSYIQQSFSEILKQEIKTLIKKPHTDYKSYANNVWKVSSCTENFPVGADVVKNTEMLLFEYFKDGLACCILVLRDEKVLAPTEKNDIFNLAHSILRVLLYLVQKIDSVNITKLNSIFVQIRQSIKWLLSDEETPMDTKSVCGILFVSMHLMENSSDSWIDILYSMHNSNSIYEDFLKNDMAKLSLYSAMVTVVPAQELQMQSVDGVPAIIVLTNSVLDIGECSTDSTLILGVARTVLQLCRGLGAGGAVDALSAFVWVHLEHHVDSVQHLAAQALTHLVKHCAALARHGDVEPMDKLLAALGGLDRARKGFYVGVAALTSELGACRVAAHWPRIVEELISALDTQAVQASFEVTFKASAALEALLRQHVRHARDTCERWVRPLLRRAARGSLEPAVLNILENLLSLAAKLDPSVINYILPFAKQACERDATDAGRDARCGLMLLRALRTCGALARLSRRDERALWKDVVPYDALYAAAVDARPENRILSISLIVESPKSTEAFAKGELDFVLWFMRYNINEQTPHFRQLVLSTMKKFLKRLESSYRVVRRESITHGDHNGGEYYLEFVNRFRALCFASLLPGANYSRRHVALQLLARLQRLHSDGLERNWGHDEVEVLLHHLGDSYEVNKALALQLLCQCPTDMLKAERHGTSLHLKDILAEASSVKPTDCVTAVYKLKLLRTKLPDHIVDGPDSAIPNKVAFELLRVLLEEAQKQLAVCQQSIVLGARCAPMYGVLHCIGFALEPICPLGIDAQVFSQTLQALVHACAQVCECAGHVLSSAAPEGLLPAVTPHSAVHDTAHGCIRLEDGGEVSAQMVLLCAWRSVKEASLILSSVVAPTLLRAEGGPARHRLVRSVGRLFTELLTDTKHRGAFEQVYVGFTRLLASLWRSDDPQFTALPAAWLRRLMAGLQRGDGAGLCATRRSAGLPFMIQALVITELQVKMNTRSFEACVRTLLRVARSAPAAPARCHCLNILRALYRSSQLEQAVAPLAGAGLLVALQGFHSGAWLERNSATLLFSALMVRIFGVQRGRDAERLCVRNRMTGRIFFLRYPQLYDFMLNKLKEVSENREDRLLRPSLYPILLLLARLYPSALEGTVSNLKLVSFVPHVVSCGASAVLKTRQLAAQALPPLVSPDRYVSHIESMLILLTDKHINRNFCHGILLQLLKLLDARPENIIIDQESNERIRHLLENITWIIEQSLGDRPCYLLTDEYLKIINLLLKKFKSLVDISFLDRLLSYLDTLVFERCDFKKYPGKELCLANATYLHLIILNIHEKTDEINLYLIKSLTHDIYEVQLAVLNYLLLLYGELEIENAFQEHLMKISKAEVLNLLKKDRKHLAALCKVLKGHKYSECKRKCLTLLTLEVDTQRYIIHAMEGDKNTKIKDDMSVETRLEEDETIETIALNNDNILSKDNDKPETKPEEDNDLEMKTKDDDVESDRENIIDKLLHYIKNEHESLTHIFLKSLCDFLTRQTKVAKTLEASRVIFECSLSDNSDETRGVVVGYLETNLKRLLQFNLDGLSEDQRFEFRATLWATAVVLLEDELAALRLRVASLLDARVLASRAAHALLDAVQREPRGAALLALVALLDFRSEVCATDETDDECRVFDQNEKYNANLEDALWTRACAERLGRVFADDCARRTLRAVRALACTRTFQRLCGDNYTAFVNMMAGEPTDATPKIKLFYDTLRSAACSE